MEQYIAQLTSQEKIVLKIAQQHLGSSFSLENSIGFIEWQGAVPPQPPIIASGPIKAQPSQ